LLLPIGTAPNRAAELREQGWITVNALEPCADWRAEARRLGCTHVFEHGMPQAIG
jgi:ATP phosphoribosyltransferase regulatory subunit